MACCDDCAKKGGGCAGQFSGKPFGLRPDLTQGASALAGACCAKCRKTPSAPPCSGTCGCGDSAGCCGWSSGMPFGLAPINATTREMGASLAGLEEVVEGLGVDTSTTTTSTGASWAALALTLAAGVAVGYYGPKVYAKYTRHHTRRRRMAR